MVYIFIDLNGGNENIEFSNIKNPKTFNVSKAERFVTNESVNL